MQKRLAQRPAFSIETGEKSGVRELAGAWLEMHHLGWLRIGRERNHLALGVVQNEHGFCWADCVTGNGLHITPPVTYGVACSGLIVCESFMT